MGLHESKGPGRILNTGSTLPWISTEKFGGDLGLEEFLSDKQGKWSEILFHEDSPIVRSHDELMSTIPPGARHAQMEAWEGTVDEEAIFYINQLVRNQQDWWLDAVCGEENWDVSLVKRDNKVIGSFPFFLKQKYSLFKILFLKYIVFNISQHTNF